MVFQFVGLRSRSVAAPAAIYRMSLTNNGSQDAIMHVYRSGQYLGAKPSTVNSWQDARACETGPLWQRTIYTTAHSVLVLGLGARVHNTYDVGYSERRRCYWVRQLHMLRRQHVPNVA